LVSFTSVEKNESQEILSLRLKITQPLKYQSDLSSLFYKDDWILGCLGERFQITTWERKLHL